VFYVDHCDTAELKARWAADPAVNVAKLQVDAVWGQRSLREALAEAGAFEMHPEGLDYVVASHVVEHVPDLVSWLREVAEVLAPKGTLRLAVPDRRYTFDFLRRESTLVDVLADFIRRRRAPSGARVLDFSLHVAQIDCMAAWRGELGAHNVAPMYAVESALALAQDAERNGTYHDVHCWVFTPQAFATLMADLANCRLLEWQCDWITPTARDTFEFFVAMSPQADHAHAAAGWRKAASHLATA